ncbi:MAG TPA: radical SAM protein [Blastocatellia bacterium]|nr:radical SAM protein [Blastocatellia bacterium]
MARHRKQPLAFEHVVVEVTQACHHHCLHCYNFWRDRRAPVRDPQTLTRAEILEVVRKIRCDTPLRQIGLSGGEPLLRPDLPEIATDLANEGLSIVVITSGTLLTDERLERFPADTIFEFTLFSVDAELHDRIAGRPGAFKKVIRGIECAGRHNFRLALACVINRLNAHDVLQTIELGIALKAQAALFNRINLSASTLPVADQLVPSARQLQQALDAAEEAASSYGIAVAVSVPIPPCVIDISRYKHLHFGWCPRGGDGAYYTVSYNGLLRPCNHSSVILGDLRTEGFAEIVMREATQAFWKPVPAECQVCGHPLRDSCRGGCPAASHECYGSGTRIDPFVTQCAAG